MFIRYILIGILVSFSNQCHSVKCDVNQSLSAEDVKNEFDTLAETIKNLLYNRHPYRAHHEQVRLLLECKDTLRNLMECGLDCKDASYKLADIMESYVLYLGVLASSVSQPTPIEEKIRRIHVLLEKCKNGIFIYGGPDSEEDDVIQQMIQMLLEYQHNN